MNSKNQKKYESALRLLPAIDVLLKTPTAQIFEKKFGAEQLKNAARTAVDELRVALQREEQGNGKLSREDMLRAAENLLHEKFKRADRQAFQRVINATGVMIHTNLGRAPLSEAVRTTIFDNAFGYCTLEYDLETGKRGRRGKHVEKLLSEITGAESALIVNNCAAATLLILAALASGGEAIVSRGELVEIGGDFRVPDVMAQSGVKMIEVGTTNRTKLADFENAIGENTRLLMRVHPSNYRIVGFTAMPDLNKLAKLASDKNLILYEDAGSGAIVDLSGFGLEGEPIIAESIKAGAHVVSFSGDKLLGACQAGIIVGRADVIERLRKHPLYRALRVDKIAYSALAATLEIYQQSDHFAKIPILKMLTRTKEEIEKRARDFIVKTKKSGVIGNFNFEIIEGKSAVGGGAAPLAQPPTMLISMRHVELSSENLERALRLCSPPVICRVAENRVLLDLRTVDESEEDEIITILKGISGEDKTPKP